MRFLYVFLLLILNFQIFGQIPAGLTMVVKNPTWQAEDAAKESLEKADRIRQITTLTEQVNTQKESLQAIRDATEKLRKINRKVANYHNLELAVVQVSDSYTRVLNSLKTISDHNCFKPSEYHMISESMMGLLSQTSYAITTLTVVLTDNFSEMSDGERLLNMNQAIKELRENLGVINSAIIEVEILDNQRMQLRTLNYINSIFK
ncbi:MAG: hypothetical protein IPH69_15445 [Bacteroidales bacterium]|nr:hypothetical protein [Bacteroidales bacterium]